MNPIAATVAPEIVPVFATPLVLFDVPNVAALNADLRWVIEAREKTHPTTQHSNMGGYQSSWDMDKWGGPPAIKLLAIGRNLANRVTTDKQGNTGAGPHPGFFAVTWQANMWANINRSGQGNEYHCHRGSYWSVVYYVDDGGIDTDPSLGGELEFMDPRGPIPTMLAPHLGVAMRGGQTAGERVRPKSGRMVMFPSWIMHQVRSYRGTAERISIAFNLTV